MMKDNVLHIQGVSVEQLSLIHIYVSFFLSSFGDVGGNCLCLKKSTVLFPFNDPLSAFPKTNFPNSGMKKVLIS